MKKQFLFALLLIVLPHFSSANTQDSQDKVMTYFNSSIEEMATHLEELKRVEPFPETTSLDLKKIFVRIQAIMGIEVPVFASLKIVPEIEFVIEKQ